MDSIGEMLRQARTQRGMTLDEIAKRTRISRRHLEAIEIDDRAAIPGGFFYKSFVRQYAAALGDSELTEEIEGLLAAEQPVAPPEPEDHLLRSMAAIQSERPALPANRSTATYVIFLVLAMAGSAGLYMWWHHAQQASAAGEVARAVPPQRNVELAPGTQTVPTEAQSKAPAAAVPQIAAEKPAAPAAAPVPSNPVSKIVLQVAATETTWFSVTADGKSVFAGTLQPAQSKTFEAAENARMRVGNAGGLDVTYNGKPTGPLGPKGHVCTVVFTPASFQVLKPNPDEEQD